MKHLESFLVDALRLCQSAGLRVIETAHRRMCFRPGENQFRVKLEIQSALTVRESHEQARLLVQLKREAADSLVRAIRLPPSCVWGCAKS
ncbi:hypothetical protein [Leifsonia sp. AG29]|uniref:hypothetical protein n=1 Tax=Leifsonia sp. AG29 TaxID=2598860 RepID=UPI00131B7A7A|nr:hypothetical protein [Leifsonia sp. AG29]